MTYSMKTNNNDIVIIFSDSSFRYARKKPTVSVYNKKTNTETKVASFNSQEAFEWFGKLIYREEVEV